MIENSISHRSLAKIYIDNGFNLDFFRYLFPADARSGRHLVRSSVIPGSMITYLASPAIMPVDLPERKGKTVCSVDLPMVDTLPRDAWMQYSEADMIRINQVLSDCFELDFYRYYIKGLQFGYDKKDILETYVVSRNMVNGGAFDAMSKRVYRKEMEVMKHKVSILRRKAKYFFDEADNPAIPTKK